MRLTSNVLLSLLAITTQIRAEDYAITLESNGREIAFIDLLIDGDVAIVKAADASELFDLKNQRWQHTESKQWVSLPQCETWAKQSREKSAKSTVSIPEQIRLFVVWSLNPTFTVKAADTTVTMTSGQVDYVITGKKTDDDLTNFFRYARLNAYKKAMTERKLPPFAELKVLEELERRKMMPTAMEIRTPGVAGAPTIKMAIDKK